MAWNREAASRIEMRWNGFAVRCRGMAKWNIETKRQSEDMSGIGPQWRGDPTLRMANGKAKCASTCDSVDSIEKQSEAKAKQAKVTICGAKEKQV